MKVSCSYSLVAEQLSKAAVLGEVGLERARLAELDARLRQLAEAVIGECGVEPDAAVRGVGLLRYAVGFQRALEVPLAERQVAAVVERRRVARLLLEDDVELFLGDIHHAVARIDDADLQARVEVLGIGGEGLAVRHHLALQAPREEQALLALDEAPHARA